MSLPVRHRASAVCVSQGRVLLFRAVDLLSQKEYLFPPGGQIEAGETPAQCAERETREETGYLVRAHGERGLLREYDFLWNGRAFHCATVFLPADLLDPTPLAVEDEAYIKEAIWLPVNEVEPALHYDRSVQQAVMELVRIF